MRRVGLLLLSGRGGLSARPTAPKADCSTPGNCSLLSPSVSICWGGLLKPVGLYGDLGFRQLQNHLQLHDRSFQGEDGSDFGSHLLGPE